MTIAKETRSRAWRTLSEAGCYGAFLMGQLLLQFLGSAAFVGMSVVLVLAGTVLVGREALEGMRLSESAFQGREAVLRELGVLCESVAGCVAERPQMAVAALCAVALAALGHLYVCAFAEWGRCAMSMAAVRRGLKVSHSLSGWGGGWRMAGLVIWRDALVLVQLLLFVAPGVRALFSYAMAPYLLVDHPDWTARRCLAESKRLMDGNRWRLFCLGLSFFGWAFLAVLVTVCLRMLGGMAMLCLAPYMHTAFGHFYEELLDADFRRTHPADAIDVLSEEPPVLERESDPEHESEQEEQERNR